MDFLFLIKFLILWYPYKFTILTSASNFKMPFYFSNYFNIFKFGHGAVVFKTAVVLADFFVTFFEIAMLNFFNIFWNCYAEAIDRLFCNIFEITGNSQLMQCPWQLKDHVKWNSPYTRHELTLVKLSQADQKKSFFKQVFNFLLNKLLFLTYKAYISRIKN